jgi:hypothetical protein
MLCTKCGSKIDDNINFCGKCGAKAVRGVSSTTTAGSSTNANNLDSFISNISNKPDKKAIDSDVFSKIDNTDNIDEKENNDKNIKKKKFRFKDLLAGFKKTKTNGKPKPRSKPKSKPRSKPKSKPRSRQKPKSSGNASKKKINMKILVPAILVLLAVIIGVFVFVFFNGKSSNPNKDVVKALKATLMQIEKHTEKTKHIPNFSIDEHSDLSKDKNESSKIFEKERYYKIKNAKGGLLNEDILGSLKGLSLKLSEKQDLVNDLINAKLTFSNDRNEEIFAEISSSSEFATMSLPSLYHSKLGMHFRQEEIKKEDDSSTGEGNIEAPIINTPYYDDVSQLLDLLKNGEGSFNTFKNSNKDKMIVLVSDIVKNAEFNLISENEQLMEKEYSTLIDNIALLESLKVFLTEIKEDDFNKKLQLLFTYSLDGETLKLAEFLTIGSSDTFINSIDNTINVLEPKVSEKDEANETNETNESGVSVGEIAWETARKMVKEPTEEKTNDSIIIVPKETEIKLITNENKTISSISFSIVIDGILISIKIDIEESENNLKLKTNINMSKGDSQLTLDILSLNEQTGTDEIRRGNTISLTTFLDDKMEFDSYDTYNLKTNVYNSILDIIVNDKSGELLLNYDLSGKYKEEGESKRLDIDSMKIIMKEGLYSFYLEFVGHILKHSSNSSSIEHVNPNNVIFIDNMKNQETNEIKEEINKNWTEFIEKFRNRGW